MNIKVLFSSAVFLTVVSLTSSCSLCSAIPDLSICSNCNSRIPTGIRPSLLPQYLRRLRLRRPSLLRKLACPEITRRELVPSSSEEEYKHERSRGRKLFYDVDNDLPMKREVIEYEPKKTVKVKEFEMYGPETDEEEEETEVVPKKSNGYKKTVKTVEEIYERTFSSEEVSRKKEDSKELDEVVFVTKTNCGCKKNVKPAGKCTCGHKKEPKREVIEYVTKKNCGCKKCKNQEILDEDMPVIIGEIEYVPKETVEEEEFEIVPKKTCTKTITIISKCKCGQEKAIEYVPKKRCGCKKIVKIQEEIKDGELPIIINGIEYEIKKKHGCKKSDKILDDDYIIRIDGIEYIPKK